MSTFPELFRDNQTKSTPKKQGGIFSLKMQKSGKVDDLMHKKFSHSRIGTSHTNRTAIDNFRSSHRPHSRQSFTENRIGDWSARLTWALEEAKISNSEQVSNLGRKLEQQSTKMNHMKNSLEETHKESENLREQLQRIKIQWGQQVQQIEEKTKKYCFELRKALSSLRRESGMETKVSRQQVQELTTELKQIEDVNNEFDNKVRYLSTTCTQ